MGINLANYKKLTGWPLLSERGKTMADLIDRAALLAESRKCFCSIHTLIREAPAVDAVAVVRCENCIMHNDCKFEQYQGLNGFCSLGERKENG